MTTLSLQETARRSVTAAIRSGALTRQPCEICGCEPAEAHHEDYAAPLEVRWLCRSHHRRRHSELLTPKTDDGVNLTLRLDERLVLELRRAAKSNDRSVSAEARQALRNYLREALAA